MTLVYTPSIPLNNPYTTPLYNPLYSPPLRSLDYSSHVDGCAWPAAASQLSAEHLAQPRRDQLEGTKNARGLLFRV